MSAAASSALPTHPCLARLDEHWALMRTLTLDSPESEFEKWAAFYDPSPINHVGIMEAPDTSREMAIAKLKMILGVWIIKARKVISSAVVEADDGAKVTTYTEIRNDMLINGQMVKEYPELEVTCFEVDKDTGTMLIKEYKVYSDTAPVRDIILGAPSYPTA